MANLGNAGTYRPIRSRAEQAGMRDPVFPTTPAGAVTISTGNQFQGGGNPGNQLQVGSSLLFKQATDPGWTTVPLIFLSTRRQQQVLLRADPGAGVPDGTVVQYYLRVAYDDHDTTFVLSGADGMIVRDDGGRSRGAAAPFTFTIETTDMRGQWGPVFPLPNVGIHAHVLPNGQVLMWGRRDSPDQSLDVDPASPFEPGGPCPTGNVHAFPVGPGTGAADTNPAAHAGRRRPRRPTCSAPATPSCPTAACWWRAAISPTAWVWTRLHLRSCWPTRGRPRPS